MISLEFLLLEIWIHLNYHKIILRTKSQFKIESWGGVQVPLPLVLWLSEEGCKEVKKLSAVKQLGFNQIVKCKHKATSVHLRIQCKQKRESRNINKMFIS